jgi:hypothetical protein
MSVVEMSTRRIQISRVLLVGLLCVGLGWSGHGANAQTTYTLGGRIDNTGVGTGTGISGVTVTLTDLNTNAQLATRVTDAAGDYAFTGLAAGGSYEITPSKAGFVFQPTSRGRTNLNQNFTSEHFAGSPTTTGTVGFSSAAYSVNEGVGGDGIGTDGTGFRVITVTRSGDTTGAATVDYATSDGTAERRRDYTQTLGTLRFAPGETAKTFTVFITDDVFAPGAAINPQSPVVVEAAAETVNLSLSNPTGVVLGGQSTATLTINDNDSTTGPNPVKPGSFNSRFYVRQHYLDFLNREPDLSGLNFWTNEIESCGADAQCREAKRINVSAAFFLSIEFQETGYFVQRLYKTAYGDSTSPNVPGTVPIIRIQEFLFDTQRIGQGVQVGVGNWQAQLEANKNAMTQEFVQRQRFVAALPPTLTPAQFVDTLNANAGGALSQSERDALVNALTGNTMTRAQVLRAVAEDQTLRDAEFNRAFVLMQYYGYLRRNPDDAPDSNFGGWKFWLDKLNQFQGNFVNAQMVQAFLDSIEYGNRFGL